MALARWRARQLLCARVGSFFVRSNDSRTLHDRRNSNPLVEVVLELAVAVVPSHRCGIKDSLAISMSQSR